jgi:hypothetical protein
VIVQANVRVEPQFDQFIECARTLEAEIIRKFPARPRQTTTNILTLYKHASAVKYKHVMLVDLLAAKVRTDLRLWFCFFPAAKNLPGDYNFSFVFINTFLVWFGLVRGFFFCCFFSQARNAFVSKTDLAPLSRSLEKAFLITTAHNFIFPPSLDVNPTPLPPPTPSSARSSVFQNSVATGRVYTEDRELISMWGVGELRNIVTETVVFESMGQMMLFLELLTCLDDHLRARSK